MSLQAKDNQPMTDGLRTRLHPAHYSQRSAASAEVRNSGDAAAHGLIVTPAMPLPPRPDAPVGDGPTSLRMAASGESPIVENRQRGLAVPAMTSHERSNILVLQRAAEVSPGGGSEMHRQERPLSSQRSDHATPTLTSAPVFRPTIPDRPLDTRRARAIELGVFLFLIVPSMLLSFAAVQEGQLPFGLVAFSTIARDLSLVALIFFFISRNREPLAAIGWQARRLGREVVLGLALFPPFFFASTAVDAMLRSAGFSGPSTPQPNLVPSPDPGQLVLALLLVVVVALSEETIFRGYLIRRLEELSGSPAWAIILSAGIFSLGHGYEGSAGVLTVGLSGVVLGIVYWWRRSIIAPVVMHFLLDLAAIVVIPALLR